MQTPGIRNRILVPLGAALLLLLGTFVLGVYQIQQTEVATDAQNKIESVEDLFHAGLNGDTLRMRGLIEMLMRDESVKAALEAEDRSALLKKTKALFEKLRLEQGITHLYFSAPNRVNIVRIHMPDVYGDRIDRATTLEAERTGKVFGGIELGPLGTLTLRVVAPWFDGNRLIGFVELGEDIDHIIGKVHDVLGVQLLVAIEKKLLERSSWEAGMRMLGREATWDRFSTVVIVSRTIHPIPDKLSRYIDEDHHTSKVTNVRMHSGEKSYSCRFLHLKDASGRGVGDLVVMEDVTPQLGALHTAMAWVGGICVAIGGALALFFYLFWGRVEGQLFDAQQKILELERDRSKFILDHAPAHISLMDENGRFTQWSPYAEGLFGYKACEAVGRIGLGDLMLHPELLETMRPGLEAGNPFCAEIEGRKKDGAPLWFRLHIVRMPEQDGIEGLLCIAQDISGQKRVEEALRESEERYRVIFNSGNDAVFVHWLTEGGQPGSLIEINEMACQRLGYSREELLKLTPVAMVEPETRFELPQLAKRLREEKSILFETVLLSKDGGKIPFEVHSHLFDLRGRETVLSVARDISERKREEEERIRLVTGIEQVAESVLIIDPDWKIRYANPAFERISGYRHEEIMGRHPRLFSSGDHDPSFYKSIRETVERGDVWSGRLRSRKKDGTNYEVEATITPIRGKTGKIDSFVTIERDVTHEAELERQLRQAQKMEALGTLAGGIAHDFNNILAAIMGNCEMGLHNLKEPDRARRNLDQVLIAANRATDLVKQILTFSRQSEQERKPAQIGLLVKETLKFLRASLPATIEIRQNVLSQGMVLADPTQIHQVLMNLCTNAAHAMREQGGILEVSLTDSDSRDGRIPPAPDQGRYMRLAIKDTGPGIEPAIMDRIFDPYFTTKKPGEGTGLGLAVVLGIVEGHGGSIQVESEPGSGTSFYVFLPRIDSAAVREVEPIALPEGGTERILLVDDESPLLEVGRQMLEYLGYSVLTMTNGLEALEAIQASPERFDLVITDQTMPQMTGIQLAGELERIGSSIPVILCTGFSEQVMAVQGKPEGVCEFLIKPVIMQQLAETVRRALNRCK